MSGYGESSKSENGDPGHLYIEIDVQEHEWFERDGADLLMALPLTFTDLVLGTTVEIPHLDGEILKIKIPPGSKPSQTISVKGRGLPSNRARNGRGSIMVLLKLDMPEKITRTFKKKLIDIRDEMNYSNSLQITPMTPNLLTFSSSSSSAILTTSSSVIYTLGIPE